MVTTLGNNHFSESVLLMWGAKTIQIQAPKMAYFNTIGNFHCIFFQLYYVTDSFAPIDLCILQLSW